jgi:cytochrome b6-f complex iron-sulfur subunit
VSMTRRKFLNLGWKIGGTLLGIAAGWTVFESLRPLAGASGGGTIPLGTAANYPVDSATYVTEGRFYVVNTQDKILAISQKCPHLGCRVPFCESSGRFECACHGSVFDIGGEWIKGPAPRGMDSYPVTETDGILAADTSTTVPGPDHGANQYFTPPKGPSCLEKG